MSLFGISMLIISIAIITWYLYCNEKTFKQRRKILVSIFSKDNDEWDLELQYYHTVSYSEHLTAILFLRDPRKLYHASLHKYF